MERRRTQTPYRPARETAKGRYRAKPRKRVKAWGNFTVMKGQLAVCFAVSLVVASVCVIQTDFTQNLRAKLKFAVTAQDVLPANMPERVEALLETIKPEKADSRVNFDIDPELIEEVTLRLPPPF
ncbi:hypothetical protein AGMMS49975_00650 [Clostridia bacterium]|nr:hypothetical protein AGMMS49975_00650 [Clostridia bacterium]